MAELQKLPLGIQNFEMLRSENKLYVDKTALLMELPSNIPRCFLSRPRRFGKSLTLSTLDAMFSGRAELFKGLAAEEWVKEKAAHPTPVLRFDMSGLNTSEGMSAFRSSLLKKLKNTGKDFDVVLEDGAPGDIVGELIERVAKKRGNVAVLVDEYDKPILDNIDDLEQANEIRVLLSSFYTVLKSCDEYIEFLMLTGISKFSKMSIFSAMNNLNDISMDRGWGTLLGYTQEELESSFAGWIDRAAQEMNMDRGRLLEQMKTYYDGFCFNGRDRVYNPFSVMQFFQKARFSNYWYGSGSPSFIVKYLKKHDVPSPETFRRIVVNDDFTGAQEIENAKPESFLYQAGYLTIEREEGVFLILDYPNREVLDALSRLYLGTVYQVPGYGELSMKMWQSLKAGDVSGTMEEFNRVLVPIPYGDFSRHYKALYRSIFLAALRTAGIQCVAESQSSKGRSDVIAFLPGRVMIFEFKLARKEDESEWDRLLKEAQRQIAERGYAKPYEKTGNEITTAAVVVDVKRRQIVRWSSENHET